MDSSLDLYIKLFSQNKYVRAFFFKKKIDNYQNLSKKKKIAKTFYQNLP